MDEYFGWSYGWAQAGTLGFLVTTVFIAVMYTTFIFSFTELTTAIPHAGGPFAYSYRAFEPVGGYVAGSSTQRVMVLVHLGILSRKRLARGQKTGRPRSTYVLIYDVSSH